MRVAERHRLHAFSELYGIAEIDSRDSATAIVLFPIAAKYRDCRVVAMQLARTAILNVNIQQRLTLGAVADDC